MTSRSSSDRGLYDSDLVDRDGRLPVIGSYQDLAFSWDPTTDQWAEHRLHVPSRAIPFVELNQIGAAVVDGRIVVGGGGDRQDFARWDRKPVRCWRDRTAEA